MLDDYIKMLLNSKDYSYSMCCCFYDYFAVNFLDELDEPFNGTIQIKQENGTFKLIHNGSNEIIIMGSSLDNVNQIEILTKSKRILFKEGNESEIVLIEGNNKYKGDRHRVISDFNGSYDGILNLQVSGVCQTYNETVPFKLTEIKTFEELSKESNMERIKSNSYSKKNC